MAETLTDLEATLKAAGWRKTKRGNWRNTRPFFFRDPADPLNRHTTVPAGVTRPAAEAYALEQHRAPTPTQATAPVAGSTP